MAAGKPIIYAGKGVAAELLHQIGCAVTVTPEDSQAISAALAELLGDPEHMRVLGSRGRACVRSNFHRATLMEEFAHALEERFAGASDV
jgi:glycosyltransferase involved in cell wall biosynthesis